MIVVIIGERIKQERIKKGLSQEELGKLLGVSKVSICGYETGNRIPNMDTFVKLIDVLNIEPNYILGRDTNVINDKDESYVIKMAKDDIIIINEIKKNTVLYNKLCHDPSRTIELISRKIK